MIDKVLVTNSAALRKKYKDGSRAVLAAARQLIAADKKRGLTARLVDISDKAKMAAFQGKPVTSLGNERQCKDAVDAIYAKAKPDYIVLIDGPDVVPHLTLNNPASGDGDAEVPSDLPYACDAPFTSRDPAKYVAVTRVVGRIPGVTGAAKPDFVIKQLKAAAAYRSRTRTDYLDHFAISAEVWKASTLLSVENIFGNDAINTCPATGSPAVRKLLTPLSHFINCHGAEVDPHFYGQKGNDYPVAIASADVAAGAKRNTVIAAECCYGAQLFDPEQAGNVLPIPNTYLRLRCHCLLREYQCRLRAVEGKRRSRSTYAIFHVERARGRFPGSRVSTSAPEVRARTEDGGSGKCQNGGAVRLTSRSVFAILPRYRPGGWSGSEGRRLLRRAQD